MQNNEETTIKANKDDLIMYLEKYLEDSELYSCEKCDYNIIIQEFGYCPNCGRKIDWEEYNTKKKKRLEQHRKKYGYMPSVYTKIHE